MKERKSSVNNFLAVVVGVLGKGGMSYLVGIHIPIKRIITFWLVRTKQNVYAECLRQSFAKIAAGNGSLTNMVFSRNVP